MVKVQLIRSLQSLILTLSLIIERNMIQSLNLQGKGQGSMQKNGLKIQNVHVFLVMKGTEKNSKTKLFVMFVPNELRELFHIYRHLKTQYHIKRSKSVKSASVPALFTKKKQPSRDAERFRLMLLKFLCEHNISFNVMDHLMQVLKNGARDSQIIKNLKSGRQISRDIVVKCIGNESLKEIVEILKAKANKYSIMVDESTDVSTTKLVAIVVRVVNKEKGTVDDRFLQLLDVQDSSAEGLFQLLSNFFLSKWYSICKHDWVCC